MKIVEKFGHGPVKGFRLGYSPIRWVEPLSVCFYYVDGLLVDTGQRHMQQEVGELVRPLPVQQIFLTHHHEDHSGNVRFLKDELQVPIYASELAVRQVASSFAVLPYEQFWFGKIEACPGVKPAPDQMETDHYRFDVIATPGHSEDLCILHERNEGWLLAGDLYIGKLKIFRKGENIRKHIESTRKVLALDFDVIFCGHNPVFKEGKKALAAKVEYLETIYGKVAELHTKGISVKEIQKTLHMKESSLIKLFTFWDVSVRNIIQSVVDSENERVASSVVKIG